MRKWSHILVFVAFTPSFVVAQSFSNKGRFSIEFDKGCTPFTVNITTGEDFREGTTLYSFESSAGFTNDTTFTFNERGIYEIIQVVNKDSINGEPIGEKEDTLTIEVIEPRRPEIEVTRCTGLEVSITSVDSFYDSIRVYYSPTDSVTLLPNGSNRYSFSSTGLQTIRLKGLFNNADEVCQEYTEEIDPLPDLRAPEILSASVKQLCRDSYVLYLTLAEVLNGVNYRVLLEQQSSTTLFDGFLDTTSLAIQEIPFNVEDYCISVETFDPCNNATQNSNQICDSPTSLSLSPFETLYSSHQESFIYINLDQVSLGTFEVDRRFDGGEFQPRGEQSGSFEDPIGSSSRKFFYRIGYRDVCGELLYSEETHPPHVDAEEIDDNRYEITFAPADNSLETLISSSYTVGSESSFSTEQLASNVFNLNLSPENGSSSQLLSIQSTYENNIVINSNPATLSYEFIVYVPSAFTPNGDGVNDLLEFFGVPSENASVKIYSRWGQTIYTSADLSAGWDGRVAGKPAQSGTYFYEIFFETTDGNKLRQRGTFVLLEK